jgi:hypothetical protein
MNKSVIKLKSEELYIFDREDDYVIYNTIFIWWWWSSIYQDIEDSMDKRNRSYSNNYLTSKKIELARFEDLEIRQVKINLLWNIK